MGVARGEDSENPNFSQFSVKNRRTTASRVASAILPALDQSRHHGGLALVGFGTGHDQVCAVCGADARGRASRLLADGPHATAAAVAA